MERLRFGRGSAVRPPSNGEGLGDIQTALRICSHLPKKSLIKNFIFCAFSAKHERGTRHEFSYLIHYDSLLQNVTDIMTKCDRSLLQNMSGFLLQNATVLSQNATVISNCDDFITK